MSSVVATVKSIVGQVFVISPEGARRVLVEGDRLFAGDQIDTGLSGAVSLELADGRILDLGRDTQWSADMPDSTADLAAASEQAAPSVATRPPTWKPLPPAQTLPVMVLPGAATASWCWTRPPAV